MADLSKGIFSYLCRNAFSVNFFVENQLNLVNNKAIAKKFVNSLGIRVVRQLKLFSKLENIKLLPGTVLKPSVETFSKGVFLVHTENLILDFTSKKLLHSLEEVYTNAKSYLEKQIVHIDLWNQEEMVLGRLFPFPPDEIKLYCFYGKIGMIFEKQVISKGAYFEYAYIYYTVSGDEIYLDDPLKGIVKRNLTVELEDLAKKISLQLPLAFIRIDFLINKESEFVFSEFELNSAFTPIPGSVFQKMDAHLANFYKEAENRLAEDINCGKKFIEGNEILMNLIRK